jgi:LPS-assembly lipoprotein
LLFKLKNLLLTPLALITLLISACGFEPVYGTGGTGSALQGNIEVSAPDTIDTYLLVQNLEQRLGRSSDAEYDLNVTLRTEFQGQAITASNETTRYSIVGQVDYALLSVETGEIIASGNVRNFTGYSATGSTVDTLASERDARKRLMTILADQLTTQLYATVELPE